MGASVFGIGLSGLNAASLGLSTTGHNIANANTLGYSRQNVKQSAPYPQYTGNGFTGLGVRVDTVQRSYDEFLTKQVQTATSQDSYYGTYLAEIKQVDNLVADPAAGVSPVLQSFFSAVQGMATNPASLPARQSLMSNAQGLVNRFQVFDQRLSEMRAGVNGNLVSAADHVTALSKQIAQINGQIAVSSSGGQLPNDLLDQRDQMVLDLNTLVKATSIKQSDGSINVFIGNGQNLVVGGTAYAIAAKPSISDPQRLSIVYTQGAIDAEIPETMLTGGQLGGLLEYRSKVLDSAQNSIERMAVVLGQTFNAQMRQGQDLYGNMGTNFFDYPQGNVSLVHTVVAPPAANVSSTFATVSLPAGVKSVASDYSLKYDPASAGNEYVITRLSDNVSQSVSAASMGTGPTVLGLTWNVVAGTMAAGEKVGVSMPPVIGNVLSNRNNTAAIPPAVAPVLGGYIEDVSKIQASDYEVFYDGTDYQVTRQSDGQRTQITGGVGGQFANNANSIVVDGLRLSFSQGTPTAGDRFTVQPYAGFSRSLSIKPTDPRVIAAGVPIISNTQRTNTGTGKISQVSVDAASTITTQSAVNPALKNPVTITFASPTTYTLTDGATTSAPIGYVAGQLISFNGWNVKIDGQPAQGDKFSIDPGTSLDADGRNALKLGELQSRKIIDGGKANYQEAYGQMVAVIGAKTNEVAIMSTAQIEVRKQAEISRDSVSAVNLDEEAANLLRYQQAYQASSKVIQIAQQAFDAIVRIGG
ncbi:flagellar hook-associated protein FlgK [Iodobacter sp.]|uniref:flagellar hook-associated protein FlgK n=1 Tax=Iodobacter sp. TaxID=1915058 RepID=UPI0025D049EC|nr:flagellar hook-associated protein FlgK [Iodobacter sp.]